MDFRGCICVGGCGFEAPPSTLTTSSKGNSLYGITTFSQYIGRPSLSHASSTSYVVATRCVFGFVSALALRHCSVPCSSYPRDRLSSNPNRCVSTTIPWSDVFFLWFLFSIDKNLRPSGQGDGKLWFELTSHSDT